MEIFEADKSFQEALDKFYQEQGYHSNWSETERAFICLSEGRIPPVSG